MKWRVRKLGTIRRALHRWHPWFAWYPVRIPTKGPMSGMTKVWLETVYRKGTYCGGGMGDFYWDWKYKLNK